MCWVKELTEESPIVYSAQTWTNILFMWVVQCQNVYLIYLERWKYYLFHLVFYTRKQIVPLSNSKLSCPLSWQAQIDMHNPRAQLVIKCLLYKMLWPIWDGSCDFFDVNTFFVVVGFSATIRTRTLRVSLSLLCVFSFFISWWWKHKLVLVQPFRILDTKIHLAIIWGKIYQILEVSIYFVLMRFLKFIK